MYVFLFKYNRDQMCYCSNITDKWINSTDFSGEKTETEIGNRDISSWRSLLQYRYICLICKYIYEIEIKLFKIRSRMPLFRLNGFITNDVSWITLILFFFFFLNHRLSRVGFCLILVTSSLLTNNSLIHPFKKSAVFYASFWPLGKQQEQDR